MRKLSDSLAELQAKVTAAQQSAKKNAKENEARLEERSRRREDSLQAGFADSVNEVDDFVRDWWYGSQDEADRRSRKIHEAIARWRAEGKAESAQLAAELAEQHATAASDFAGRMVDEAEAAAQRINFVNEISGGGVDGCSGSQADRFLFKS